jgi:mRNA-degrading endonuclease RelE of RelBE toxin-antitoxin system
MDRNAKFLKKLSKKEFDTLAEIVERIESQKTDGLNILKLKGHQDVFRVRVGNIRIIFLATRDKVEILEISRRSEKTYKDF